MKGKGWRQGIAMEDSPPWFVGEGNEEKRRWQTSTDYDTLTNYEGGSSGGCERDPHTSARQIAIFWTKIIFL